KRLPTSTDHMASANAPYHREGTVAPEFNDPLDFQGIANQANQILRSLEAEQAQADRAQASQPTVQETSEGFQQALNRFAVDVPGHEGVRSVSGDAIEGLFTKNTGATKDQIGLFRDLVQSNPEINRMTFFFGSSEALTSFRNLEFPDHAGAGPVELGQTISGSNTILIANQSPETVLHELLHGYTANLLSSHYADPDSSPAHVRFAVARLEELRDDILGLVPDALTVPRSQQRDGDTAGAALARIQEVLQNYNSNAA